MFGKPEWFGEKRVAWPLQPACWQGWAYAIVWLSVLVLPLFCLLSTSRVPEAAIWLLLAGGYFVWDVRQVIRSKTAHRDDQDVLYITDDPPAPLRTRNYEFQLRQ
jgi:hypothetical protein